MQEEELKKTIRKAKRIMEEFEHSGEGIDPMWLLYNEMRGFRNEMRALILGFSLALLGTIISFGIVILSAL